MPYGIYMGSCVNNTKSVLLEVILFLCIQPHIEVYLKKNEFHLWERIFGGYLLMTTMLSIMFVTMIMKNCISQYPVNFSSFIENSLFVY